MRFFSALMVCIALLSVGCHRRDPVPPSSSDPSASSSDLRARLDAAKAITFTGERDQALAVVARDAAKAGDVTVTKGALGSITFTSAKDEAAADSALKLAAAGQAAAANDMARMITFTTARDATLKKLATGGR